MDKNYNKLNKALLKNLIKTYKQQLINDLSDIKKHKLSKMKKGELVALCENLFNKNKNNNENNNNEIENENEI